MEPGRGLLTGLRAWLEAGVSPRHSALAIAILGALFVPLVLLQDSGFLVVSPGPSFPVRTSAQVDGRFDAEHWRMLTVEASPATWGQMIGNALGASEPTVPQAVRGRSASPSEAAQMKASAQAASALAYRIVSASQGGPSAADAGSGLLPRGALVLEVLDGSPALRSGMRPGDVIVRVDDVTVDTAEDLLDAPRDGRHMVRLRRDGEVLVVPVTGEPDGFGLQVVTWFDVDEAAARPLPPQEVGGSSAGLAFALALVDALQPGDLTGGRVVAATGVLESDGSVGPVVGVAQKLVGAAADGAILAFVPMGSEVGTVPDGMTVVPVASVADALSYLCSHGGSGKVCA